jgi:hypothetical protein
MIADTLVRQMPGAFEVSHACFDTSFSLYPPFFLGSDFGVDRGQEVKERSRHKSLFIHHESGVWAVLTHQWALVKEANEQLSKKSAKADELRVVHVAVREEVV